MMTRIVVAIAIAQSCGPERGWPPRLPLSAGHVANIHAEAMAKVDSVRELPDTVQHALRSAFGQSWLPVADRQVPAGTIWSPWSRSRRLLVAGCGPDHCLVHYEQSRFVSLTFQVVVFGLNPDNAQVEWSGNVRQPLNGLAELRHVVRQRAVEP
jgi:hypothetical protein